MNELCKCGILCAQHHPIFDNYYKYGPPRWPKASFDREFKAEGVKAAKWKEWRMKHLELSEHCDEMISENLS